MTQAQQAEIAGQFGIERAISADEKYLVNAFVPKNGNYTPMLYSQGANSNASPAISTSTTGKTVMWITGIALVGGAVLYFANSKSKKPKKVTL